jgi:glycosyltransferase involved in cell wall biosynthesis
VGTPVAAYPVPGPLDIIEPGVTGCLDQDLTLAINQCLTLDRQQVEQHSQHWSWGNCWNIFKENLV